MYKLSNRLAQPERDRTYVEAYDDGFADGQAVKEDDIDECVRRFEDVLRPARPSLFKRIVAVFI